MRSTTLAVLAAIGFVTPAAAAPAGAPLSVRVPYGDLNISSPEGLLVLKRRVRAAVQQVCAEASRDTFNGYLSDADCRANTQAGAERDIARHRNRSVALLEPRPA